jgi:hypothetical protein
VNLLNIITNIEVRAMVADNPVALGSARTAYRLACESLRASGAGDKDVAKGKRAVCFRNMRSAVALLEKEAA